MPVWAIILIIIAVLIIISLFFKWGRTLWIAFIELIFDIIGGIFEFIGELLSGLG
jgi:hypothetical protein